MMEICNREGPFLEVGYFSKIQDSRRRLVLKGSERCLSGGCVEGN